jgi:hypothetical protein
MDLISQAIGQIRSTKVQQVWEQLVLSPFLRIDEMHSILGTLQKTVANDTQVLAASSMWSNELQAVIASQRNSNEFIEILGRLSLGSELSSQDRTQLMSNPPTTQELAAAKTLKDGLFFTQQRRLMELEQNSTRQVFKALLSQIDLMHSVQTRWVCFKLLNAPTSPRIVVNEEFAYAISRGVSAHISLRGLLERYQNTSQRNPLKNTLSRKNSRSVQIKNDLMTFTLERISENNFLELLKIHKEGLFEGAADFLSLVQSAHAQQTREIFEGEMDMMTDLNGFRSSEINVTKQ